MAAVAEGPRSGIRCCDALARATSGQDEPTGDRQMQPRRIYLTGGISVASVPVGIYPPDSARASASHCLVRVNDPSTAGSDGGCRTAPAATCTPAVHRRTLPYTCCTCRADLPYTCCTVPYPPTDWSIRTVPTDWSIRTVWPIQAKPPV